ncbi:MAG: hypothetical protein LAN36_14505 [Acidobacteriia bacterium]|nr:hypothetical protein [Terriglobia bacterium]
MFESICIARDGFVGGPVDFGQLAESLIFYQQVHFLADHETFVSLVRTWGSDVVLELCQMGTLKIHYAENLTAVGTHHDSTPLERHGLVTVKAQNQNFLNQATHFFEEYCGPSGKGLNKTLRRFSKFVESFEYPKSILGHLQSELPDREYIRASVQGLLASLAPDFVQPNPLVFDIFLESNGEFRVETNINFTEANESYHRRVSPEHSSLSKAFIMASLLSARSNMETASQFSSDLALGPVSSIISANKIASLFKEHDRNRDVLDRFTELVVNDSRAIAQAVNNRQRSFADVLELVQQAQKFKDWLRKQGPSADLSEEYCREVSRLDWADRLPPKAVRWLLVNVAGLAIGAVSSPTAAVLTSLGISAADAFLLEKLLRGWRPNQFIEGPLKSFIRTT